MKSRYIAASCGINPRPAVTGLNTTTFASYHLSDGMERFTITDHCTCHPYQDVMVFPRLHGFVRDILLIVKASGKLYKC